MVQQLVGFAAGAQPAPLEQGQKSAEADRQRRKKNVECNREGELQTRKEGGVDIHIRLPVASPSTYPKLDEPAWRIFDWCQPSVAGYARGHTRTGIVRNPVCPIFPPRSFMLGCIRKPCFRSRGQRIVRPVAVFGGGRRI